jgi:hypothetical protein
VAIKRGGTPSTHPVQRSPEPAQGLILEPCFRPTPYVLLSEELKEYVLDLFAEGKSLLAISRLPGFPSYGTLSRACRDPEFRKKLAEAREVRALHAESEIDELGDKAASLDKEEVPGARLAFDIHSKRAEINDPKTFGRVKEGTGEGGRPIVFQFISHIPERQKPPEVGVTPKKEKDAG